MYVGTTCMLEDSILHFSIACSIKNVAHYSAMSTFEQLPCVNLISELLKLSKTVVVIGKATPNMV